MLDSRATDFGRYLGRAVVCGVGRKVDDLVTLPLGGVSDSVVVTVTPYSSTELDGFSSEVRLLVLIVLVSPMLSRLVAGDFTLPTEVRPLAVVVPLGVSPAPLVRRECPTEPASFASFASFAFFAFSAPLPSDLFMTSARAFPIEARLSELRIEFRVLGLGGRRPPAPGVVSVDMSSVCLENVVKSREDKGRNRA